MLSRAVRPVLLAAIMLTVSAPSNASVRLGPVYVGAGVGFGWGTGPYCCSSWVYDGWGPFWGPYGPFYPTGYFAQPGPDKGTVKLLNASKDASVYIDKAYAGKVSELKTISISPGAYDLELRTPGHDAVQKRIYVLSGKTLKLEF